MAQADQQPSYAAIDVETTPIQREVFVPLGVTTTLGVEGVAILLECVQSGSQTALVSRSER